MEESFYIHEIDDFGTEMWTVDGLLHREDGPAVIIAGGLKKYFFVGREYTLEEWIRVLPIHDAEKVALYLKWK